ncbi:glycosyltransferase [Thaumasiovibrio subtropicus]|uniref:glycosyltransferase n=1 Tax=Thaumasiovibrio subtropicus TaxID=1891207 RepID=UPI000B35BBA3|nr:glycosyltransferase [Thaumasiovibrio subtropicus]
MTELIVFAEDWGRHPSSSQHIINTLQSQFAVQWVNSIGLRQPSFNQRDLLRVAEKMQQRFRGDARQKATRDPVAPFPVIRPAVWPLAENAILKWCNTTSLKQQLPPKTGTRIVWAALPSAVDYLDMLEAELVIYYVGDDFSGLAGVDHQRVAQLEKKMVARADIILCASPALAMRFPNHKTHLVSHGVDFSLFATPQANPYPASSSRHKIGFYGSLNHWLDQTLLYQLATQRPEVDFYLIGRHDCDISLIEPCPNVHFKPAVPHHQLARYVQHWDAAILPFVDNEQIRACNPLKLREYLAAGCPVISSDFPAAHQYPCHVSIAKSVAEWCEAIDAFCQLNNQHRLQYKKTAQMQMRTESWERRGQQVLSLINKALNVNQTALPNFCTN